jgi:hypothetical protein
VDDGQQPARLRSAVSLARFALTAPELTDTHRRRLLREACWYVTEGGGKYKTRFRTAGVLGLEADGEDRQFWKRLRHEHVVTRKLLVTRMLNGEDPAGVLGDAVACIVTIEEHDRLTQFDNTHGGWDRYMAAGVDVVDMATGEPFISGGAFVAGASQDVDGRCDSAVTHSERYDR